jgi:LacI family transcriptional regulator
MVLTDRSQRKVLLAITIAQQAYFRGIVRYAREHDWHLVTDMAYTGRVPIGWRGDGRDACLMCSA